MCDFFCLLMCLVLELINVDLLVFIVFGGVLVWQMEDQLQCQYQVLICLYDCCWLILFGSNWLVGSFDGEVGVEGEVLLDSGFDMFGNLEFRCVGVYLFGDYCYSEVLIFGGSLVFQCSCDKLDYGGCIEGDIWQFGLFGLYNDGGLEWLVGELNFGYICYDSKCLVYFQVVGGLVLFDQCLLGDILVWFWGVWLEGGYDFSFGELWSGLLVGFDYMYYCIDDFCEDEVLCIVFGYEKQDYDLLEVSFGWCLCGELVLGVRMCL